MAKKKVAKKNTGKKVSQKSEGVSKSIVVESKDKKRLRIMGVVIGMLLVLLSVGLFNSFKLNDNFVEKPCTREYVPVCGSDNITYSNSCLAENARVDYSNGSCNERVFCTTEQKSAVVCTLDYRPVCGDDGISYGNKCSACASNNAESYIEGVCPGFEEFEE